MSPQIRPEPEEDFEKWRVAQEFAAWQAAQAQSAPSERERAARARARQAQNAEEMSALNTASTSVMNFLDAGTFGLAGLAQDALAPGTFRANRDARQAIYNTIPTSERVALGVAGGLMNPARVPGLGAGGGMLAATGRGAVQGAAGGAAQGFGENVGTTEGGGRAALTGAATGALFGGLLGAGAERGSRALEEALNPLVRFVPEDLPGGMSVARWREAERAARRAAREEVEVRGQDERMGYEVPVIPKGPGMPEPMAIDVAGPAGVARTRQAAGTVGGREALRGPFEARAAQMAPEVTRGVPDAVDEAARLRAARKAQGDVDFPAAIAATKGQSVDSPFLQDFRNTKVGRVVWNEVVGARPAKVLAENDPSRALPLDGEGNPLPDAESIHQMMRWLRKRSRATETSFPDGIDAEMATTALGLVERARDELHPLFQKAIANYSRLSEPIDAIGIGMQRWALNPAPGKGARRSVANVREEMAGMSPESRKALRTGKRFDIASRVREGTLTPSKAAQGLARGGALASEMNVAGGLLRDRLLRWNDVLGRQKGILPTGPSRSIPQDATASEAAEKAVAPGLWWALTKGIRNKLHERNVRLEDITNTAYAKLMTGTPEEVDRVIAQLGEERGVASRQRLSQGAGSASARAEKKPRRGLLSP